jgi:ubiquinone/menaquinone biosynthesis C-methylase UbiE
MTKEIEEWWNEVSQYYQEDNKIHTKSAHYGPYSPDEDQLRLLGNVNGKNILELGCGGGQCSIAFAKQGAKCTGIDISKKQLEYAEKLAKRNKVKINFIHGSFQDLRKIKSKSYDIVFSAFAFQYSPNIKKLFKEVYRILKKKGLFVFSLDHPFSFVIYRNESYYHTGKIEEVETWPDGSKHKFVGYKRKLSDIFNALVESNFIVERIIEPFQLKKNDPWKSIYKIELVKRIAPTIIFKAKKG